MNKLLLGGLALTAFAAPAFAADMALYSKAPPPAYFGWGGYYAGVNLGYGVGTDPTTETTTAGAGILIVPAGTPLYGGPQHFDMAHRGWNGGGQIGYNWQIGPTWVLGAETDIQGNAGGHTQNCVQACNTPTAVTNSFLGVLFPAVLNTDSVSSSIDWFGTVRGRIGFTTGPALLYFTGGFAYGDVNRSGSVSGTSIAALGGGGPVNAYSGSFSNSSIKTGWTVGAGMEARLFGNWSMKAEYLYIDLGSVTDTFSTVYSTSAFPAQTGRVAATRSVTTEADEHVFRVGLNYKLGGGY
jgi:outer membrane immunogenic protein